jgi:hypothetical protein
MPRAFHEPKLTFVSWNLSSVQMFKVMPYPVGCTIWLGLSSQEIAMPKTSRGATRPPKARTSGQSADPADTRSRPQETGKTVDLAADTVEPGQAMTGNQGLKISDAGKDHSL